MPGPFAPGFPLTRNADSFDGEPEQQWSRFTGTVLPAGVLWFKDDNIPKAGTTSQVQLLMSAPATALVVCEGAPIFTAVRETFANELRVVLHLRSYVSAITRYPKGTGIISSAAYTTSQV